MESTSPEVLYSGAFAAGKSRAGCEKGYFLSTKYPNNYGAIIRKTHVSLKYSTMETWWREVCPPENVRHWNQVSSVCELVNGSKILFLGLDDPLKLGSTQFGWIFVDEGIELDDDDYRMLEGRLRLRDVPFRQLFIATNPGAPSHYLYKHFYEEHRGQVIEANSLENPYLPQDYIDRLQGFSGLYYERYVLGRWVGFEGLVYDNWDPREGIIDPFPIPLDWPRFRGIDFGYTNPFVCQWWARCPDSFSLENPSFGGWYLYKEIYKSRIAVNIHAQKIIANTFPEEHRLLLASFSDWDSGDRAILEQQGVQTTQALKDISAGVQEVYSLIAKNHVHIFRDALLEVDEGLRAEKLPTCTAEELGAYLWQKSVSGKNLKEIPQDKDNHGMDAKRYVLFSYAQRTSPSQTLASGRATRGNLSAPPRDWRSHGVGDRRFTGRLQ